MIKTITFLTILFFSVTSMFAQTPAIAFFQNETQLGNGAEITISEITRENMGDDDFPFWVTTMESELHLKNLTDKGLSVTVSQEVLVAPTGEGMLSFCFVQCVPGSVNTTIEGSLAANSFADGFHLNYTPEIGEFTTAKVKYSVYEKYTPEDVYSVTITYNYTSDSNIDNVLSDKDFTVYQNGNNTVFKYVSDKANMNLTVYNITGQIVAQYLLPNGGNFILPEKLNKGLYVYSVKEGNRAISSNKFVVK